jgi:hypothetical protein
MRRLGEKLFHAGLAFLFWMLAAASQAVTYYVDFAGGNDRNEGTSAAAAWQHSPGDGNAAAEAAAANLAAGDTVLFKGGVTYVGEVDLKWSGAPGRPITYDGNSAGGWGTGMAAMDCANRCYHAFAARHLVSSHDHIVIKNFDITHLKNVSNGTQEVNTVQGSPDGPGTTSTVVFQGDNSTYSYGGIFVYGTDWVVSGCNVHASEQWWYRALAAGRAEAAIPCLQAGINVLMGTNVLITNCAIWQIGRDCIREQGSNIAITGCDLGGPSWVALTNRGWFAVAVRAAGCLVNSSISHCTIHDGWQLGGDEARQRCHANDWIHLYGNNNHLLDEGDPNGILIDSCLMYNDRAFEHVNGTANIFIEEDVWNLTIRNCMIINPQHMGIWMANGTVSNVNLLNNTIVCYPPKVSGAAIPIYVGSPAATVNLANNLLVQFSDNSAAMPLVVLNAAQERVLSDYNLFFNPATRHYGAVRYTNLDMSLSQWSAATGNDRHSLARDPLLVNLPASAANAGAGNFNLRAESPAVGAGTNLSCLFAVDWNGTLRGKNWDIGAVERHAAESSP